MVERVDVYACFCGQGMTNWIEYYANDADRNATPKRPSMLAIVDLGAGGQDGLRGSTSIGDRIRLIAPDRRAIRMAVISHQDRDHWSLIEPFLAEIANEGVTIEQIWRGGQAWKAGAFRAVKRLANGTGAGGVPAPQAALATNRCDYPQAGGPGQELTHEGNCRIRVVAVNIPNNWPADGGWRENGTSAVIAVELGGNSIILPGDATYQTMQVINGIYLRAPASAKPAACFGLSIPHHGSLRTSVPGYNALHDYVNMNKAVVTTFSNNLNARKVVASAGPRNRHKHPYEEMVQLFGGNANEPQDPHYLQLFGFELHDWLGVADSENSRNVWTTAGYQLRDERIVDPDLQWEWLYQNIMMSLLSNGHTELTACPLKRRAHGEPRPPPEAPSPTEEEVARYIARSSSATG